MISTPALCLEVGGTKIACGVVDSDGSAADVGSHTVTGRGGAAVTKIITLVRALQARHAVSHVGVAVPGPADQVRGVVLCALDLGWQALPLGGLLHTTLGQDVRLSNDGHAAAWAEHRFGAGRVRDLAVLVTIGTGVGGGTVVGDRPTKGHRGLGGEWGHLPLMPGGRRCECGATGCWERYANGSAFVAEARRCGWNSSEDVLAAAEAGDHRATQVVATVDGHLAHGLTILGACLAPEEIIVGGGLSCDPRFVGHVRRALAGFGTHPTRAEVTIRPAGLGARAGLLGAADLARSATLV
ncbi:ROK family protein [Lentzea alba]|uniref:ROK family protein n=1 Tax=Lentzea alba TaxID=2714351 RepID=UPI0039BF6AA9